MLMIGLLNQVTVLFDIFPNKTKFLALYKNCVDEEIKNDSALLSASTLQAILDLAKKSFADFMSITKTDTDDAPSWLETTKGLLLILCQLAAFGTHEYKRMMIANGSFVFALNFVHSINLKTEALIMAG